jgi:hypothetical protein
MAWLQYSIPIADEVTNTIIWFHLCVWVFEQMAGLAKQD